MTSRLQAIRAPADRFGARLRAAWDAGEAVLPLPTDASDTVVAQYLDAMRPHLLTEVDASGEEVRREVPGPAPIADDVALVVATSGSTGRPKGVELTRQALASSTRAGLDWLGCQPGDRWLLALPIHHVAGVQVILRAWECDTEPVVVDPGDTEAIASADVDHVSLVPTQLARLVADGADLARFLTVLVGGGPVDRALLEEARSTGTRVVVSYGMTETAGGCVYDGLPLEGTEVDVRPDGRIRVRGPSLLRGYRSEAGRHLDGSSPLDPEGWFTTGDLGRFDPDGLLQVMGRVDDMILSGGENVPASAVAATLTAHPGVVDAAVVGRADAALGETVVAVVVPRDPRTPPTLGELRSHVRDERPPTWAPRELVVVDELPRDAMGSVSHQELERLAAEG